MPPSGIQWVSRFPTSTSIDDLAAPFRARAQSFVDALRVARATVVIDATFRPPQRAALMHYAFGIANGDLDPTDTDQIPAISGVDIQWVHLGPDGEPDLAASTAAAQAMVSAYDIVFEPALTSRHTEGLAIDMTVSWADALAIVDGNGTGQTITSVPRNGAANGDLHQIGRSFGVIKLLTDPPHWSSDGH